MFYRRKHDEFHSKYFTSFSQIIMSLNWNSPRSIFEHTQTFESVALSHSFARCFLFCRPLFQVKKTHEFIMGMLLSSLPETALSYTPFEITIVRSYRAASFVDIPKARAMFASISRAVKTLRSLLPEGSSRLLRTALTFVYNNYFY